MILAAAVQPQDKQSPAADLEQKQSPSAKAAPAASAKPYQAYPNNYAEACHQSQDHDVADLCAQWRAAVAAEQAADAQINANYITGAGAFLSFVSIILVLVALGQTRRANTISAEQTKVAADTARRQLRAYVTTEDHDVVGFFRGGPTQLRTKIHNRGQTPAYDVKIWSIVGGTSGDVDTYKVKQLKGEELAQSRTILGPGQWTLHKNDCQDPLNGAAYTDIVAGKLKLIFAGVVTYKDAFGKRHFTIFKQFYVGDGNWKTTEADLLACGRGNNGS